MDYNIFAYVSIKILKYVNLYTWDNYKKIFIFRLDGI